MLVVLRERDRRKERERHSSLGRAVRSTHTHHARPKNTTDHLLRKMSAAAASVAASGVAFAVNTTPHRSKHYKIRASSTTITTTNNKNANSAVGQQQRVTMRASSSWAAAAAGSRGAVTTRAMTKDNATSEDNAAANKSAGGDESSSNKKGEGDGDEGEGGGDCPLGFGKNGAITNAVEGAKKSMYLAFMSANTPLTKEEAGASIHAHHDSDDMLH